MTMCLHALAFMSVLYTRLSTPTTAHLTSPELKLRDTECNYCTCPAGMDEHMTLNVYAKVTHLYISSTLLFPHT